MENSLLANIRGTLEIDGHQLASFRKMPDLSTEELADRTSELGQTKKCGKKTIENWEAKGVAKADAARIRLVAAALNVDPVHLLTSNQRQKLHRDAQKLESKKNRRTAATTPSMAAVSPARLMPQPPHLYAVPCYGLQAGKFIGRSSELDKLDAWASSTDPLMVVEGIGGLGKSALTWEWTVKRATKAIPDLAGRVWWSFYERGTSMESFVRHTLAYIRRQSSEVLDQPNTSYYECCLQLLAALKSRPFLLILDGFERLLTAYSRWDKAQQRDDAVNAKDCECIDPRDHDLLLQLLHVIPSKILLSTRLFPNCLKDRTSHRPMLGVAHHNCDGLSRADTAMFFKHAGIEGNEQAMLRFADRYARHTLVLLVICGEIAKYPRQPYHFDAWLADPVYGGRLKLSELDLRMRQNHIFRFALEGLDEQKRKLICRIAVLAESVTYDTLEVINPFLPPKPTEVEKPDNPETKWKWLRLGDEEKQQLRAAYLDAQVAYRDYQKELRTFYKSGEYQRAIREFDKSLEELLDRRLLQWDRDTKRYDMHPVVRGHAAELLELNDRSTTYLRVHDHLTSKPSEQFESARELGDLSNTLEIYNCLIGAGELDRAAIMLRHFSPYILKMGAPTRLIELLKPYFPNGFNDLPEALEGDLSEGLVDIACMAFAFVGQVDSMISLEMRILGQSLAAHSFDDKALMSLEHSRLRNTGDYVADTLGAICAGIFCSSSIWSDICGRRFDVFSELAIGLLKVSEEFMHTDGVLANLLGLRRISLCLQGRIVEMEEAHREQKELLFNIDLPDHAVDLPLAKVLIGSASKDDWREYAMAVDSSNAAFDRVFYMTLAAEHEITTGCCAKGLELSEKILVLMNSMGAVSSVYHDLRAWALAKVDRADEARGELQAGTATYYAAKAWLHIGDFQQARNCALNAYRWAWGEGPPYIHLYALERVRALLHELGEPEPKLPLFDKSNVSPMPYELEIRQIVKHLTERTKVKETVTPELK